MSGAPDLSPAERETLRAAYERHRSINSVPFEKAIQWPSMLAVLRLAARAFDARKQSLAHPCQAALVHAAALAYPATYQPLTPQPTRANPRPNAKRKAAPAAPPHDAAPVRRPHTPTRKPDAKQRQANDVDLDFFAAAEQS